MKLVIEDAAGTRTVVPFTGGEIGVGRMAQGGGLRLPDRDVSRRHARFLHQNGAIFVEDLGSLTGTRVNGERIAGRRRLREGDLIEIGDYDLAVVPDEGLAAVAGTAAPPPLPGTAAPVPRAAPPPPVPPRTTPSTPEAALPPAQAATVTPPLQRPVPFLLACVAALLLGLVVGWAVGMATM